MAGFLLLYQPLQTNPGSWQPMLQHQAIVAVTRAILTHGTSDAPELSDHLLFAPLNLDILPLLATAASDFADFVEPKAGERPRIPIQLYDDGSWTGDPDGADELRHLLHPAWFKRLGLNLAGTIAEHHPENGLILGDPGEIAVRDEPFLTSFERIMYFSHLITESAAPRGILPGNPIAVDDLFERRMSRRERPSTSVWDTLLREEPARDLEPFVAFGPATEMATLIDGDEEDDPGRHGGGDGGGDDHDRDRDRDYGYAMH